ncbi:MAG: hypothetical protein CML79_06485 [Rhodobiaceae bacterium]|nr:hypothetical protein [Rhodobiaceae bacterium]
MHYDVEFSSSGNTCAGRLYVPESAPRGRAIVLAHGLGGTADTGLYEMAAGFCAHGFHALVFDYRNFGNSGGRRRQYISVPMQRDDWRAAIDYVCGLEDVNADRVGLWGYSFSGGHVLYMACENTCVGAVVAQDPNIDMHLTNVLGDLWRGEKATKTLAKHVSKDLWRVITGRTTGFVQIVPGDGPEPVVLNAPEAGEYLKLAGQSFENRISTSSFISGQLTQNNPTDLSDTLRTPTLIQLGTRDEIVPAEPIHTFVRRCGPHVRASGYDCHHFGMLGARLRSRAIDEAADHYIRYLMS